MAVINDDNLPHVLTGGIEDDLINGNGGDDTLDGGTAGIDTLNGGTGNDVIYARSDDSVMGEDGDDFIIVQADIPAVLDGGIGNDTLRFESGYDISTSVLTGIENLFVNGTAYMTTAQLGSFSLVSGYAPNYTTAAVALTKGGAATVNLSATLTAYFQLYGSTQAENITFNAAYAGTIYAYLGHGNDRVSAGAGNDSLRGDEGRDTLIGLGGDDTLDGGEGNDILTAGVGNDVLIMRAGDSGTGAAGDDLFSVYDPQFGVLDGGTNYDILRFEGSLDISSATLIGIEQANLYGTNYMTTAQFDAFALISGYNAGYTTAVLVLTQGGTATVSLSATLTGNFQLYGSVEAESITFDPAYLAPISAFMGSGDDSVSGASGNDSLRGDDGNDSLFGLLGNDSLDGSTGRDSLDGGAGNDYLVARAFDTVLGGLGDDFISISENQVLILGGGSGNDTIRFEGSYDISGVNMTGVEEVFLYGNDSMTAAQLDGFNLVSGYSAGYTTGAVILTQGGVASVNLAATLTAYFQLYGSAQADLITFNTGYIGAISAWMGLGDDNVATASGNDSLRGDEGNDILSGLLGADTLDGGVGLDLMDGGAGNDYFVARAFDTVLGGADDDFISISESLPAILNGGTGIDTIRFEGSYDLTGTVLTSIENLNLYGNDSMTAAQLDAFDLVSGYGPGYTSGTVILTQGGTASVELSSSLSASFTLYGSATADILSFTPAYLGILNIFSGNGNDSVTGADGSDSLRGESGNDTLFGLNGNDYLDGGAGADSTDGGNGDDVLVARTFDSVFGGNNDDLISVTETLPSILNGGNGRDTLRFENGYDVTGATITGIEVLALNGTATMTAAQLGAFNVVMGYSVGYTSASLRLSDGGPASVTLDTTLSASFTLYGSSVADTISFNTNYRGSLNIFAGFGNDSFNGANGNDNLRGEGGNDILVGFDGNDTIEGGNGADTLNGGAGIDVMYGGSGRDVFTFGATNASSAATPDRIVDFEAAGTQKGDIINLIGIDADGTFGVNDAFVFGALGLGGLSLVDSGTDTLVRLNVDNDAVFEIVILIADGAVLAADYTVADFNL